MQLILGNKNHSSWSMRAGLVARFFSAANPDEKIEEIVVPLFADGYKERLREWGPTGLVPILIDGDLRIHDSLAIAMYLVEKSPEQTWYPEETAARALARSLVCEMHSGFFKIRKWMPVDIRSTHNLRVSAGDEAGLESEIERVFSIFSAALADSGGPFLFGAYGLADIFYAPVVTRFQTYGVSAPADRAPAIEEYMANVLNQADVRAWCEEARTESYSIADSILFPTE
ncbi:MAG: glutathione S-transferase [bacterium]|nr:glutathione S-transferase [bacterium]